MRPKTCPECLGSGMDRDRKICPKCGGLGEIYEFSVRTTLPCR
ncbi:hypothetical protein A4R44_00631 [Amycolatopsis sp. M39]|uniref:Molecular chaperone DnaJ n=1 Tax=Amycolatopsis rubida TaxID=112413 RepID=A0A1I5IYP2_9PSEU|nr:hypothetical protein A4R44_00631 [Amycolatopsis sp. M39]SFO65529.1 hypothetical protein SAMN05421854_102787 [Amycolatopsis rubida]